MIVLRCNMPMLWSKLKKLWVIQYFWSFTTCSHSNFLWLLLGYIDSISTYLFVCYMPIQKAWLKNWNKKCAIFFISLSSCENWVTQIWKILIPLDSPQQYGHFEVQNTCVMIKIKEVMSNPIFLEFYYMFSFQFSMIPVQIHSSHPSIYLSLFISPFIYSSYPSSIHLTVHLFISPLPIFFPSLHLTCYLSLHLTLHSSRSRGGPWGPWPPLSQIRTISYAPLGTF